MSIGIECEQRRGHAGTVDDDADQTADEGVAEPDRPTVVADDAQPHRRLARRAAAPERLEPDRIADEHQHGHDEDERHGGCVVDRDDDFVATRNSPRKTTY